MMRTTGGSAVGETSTRSELRGNAIWSASYRLITPAWPLSASITRSWGAVISSLRLTRFDVALAMRQSSKVRRPRLLSSVWRRSANVSGDIDAQVLTAAGTH